MQDKATPVKGVYFIQAKGCPDDPIKIGYSEDVEARVRSHQCGSPQQLRVLGVLQGAGPETERRLHRRFAEHRISREWFQPTELLVRLAFGYESFLVDLVTQGDAAKVLRVPGTVIDAALDPIIEFAGPNGGRRYWNEDLQHIAAQIEEERLRRTTRAALALVRKRINAAVQEAISPESIEECIAQVFDIVAGPTDAPDFEIRHEFATSETEAA